MDKRNIIAEFLHKFAAENYPAEMYLHAADTLLYKLAEPTTPMRNWLEVNEKTPKGTLCTLQCKDNHSIIRPITSVLNGGHIGDGYYTEDGARYDTAELFVGIHLIPWTGSNGPPCKGLVFVIENHKLWACPQIFIGDICNIKNWCNVTGWAPVQWFNGKLVVDLDRLRDE